MERPFSWFYSGFIQLVLSIVHDIRNRFALVNVIYNLFYILP